MSICIVITGVGTNHNQTLPMLSVHEPITCCDMVKIQNLLQKRSRNNSSMDYGKKAMYVVLKYRDSSSLYTKDDIWIISKTINFEPRTTFVAKSSFYGPSSSGDLEVEPISGYSPSNWRSGDAVHAIWACNAGTELSCMQNLDEPRHIATDASSSVYSEWVSVALI